MARICVAIAREHIGTFVKFNNDYILTARALCIRLCSMVPADYVTGVYTQAEVKEYSPTSAVSRPDFNCNVQPGCRMRRTQRRAQQ